MVSTFRLTPLQNSFWKKKDAFPENKSVNKTFKNKKCHRNPQRIDICFDFYERILKNLDEMFVSKSLFQVNKAVRSHNELE